MDSGQPSPLRVSKDSHKIKKPPLRPPTQPHRDILPIAPPQKSRDPIIIYCVSPETIHAETSNFMNFVQRLTGAGNPNRDTPLAEIATMFATILRTIQSPGAGPPMASSSIAGVDVLDCGPQLDRSRSIPVILSPVPASLSPFSSLYFSPSYFYSSFQKFLHEPSPTAFEIGTPAIARGGNFWNSSVSGNQGKLALVEQSKKKVAAIDSKRSRELLAQSPEFLNSKMRGLGGSFAQHSSLNCIAQLKAPQPRDKIPNQSFVPNGNMMNSHLPFTSSSTQSLALVEVQPLQITVDMIENTSDFIDENGTVHLNLDKANDNKKKLENALVGKLLERHLSYSDLNVELHRKWDQFGSFQLVILNNDCFISNFRTVEARDKVLLGSPWFVADTILGLDIWQPDFSPDYLSGFSTPIWMRLPGFPHIYWDSTNILRIAAKAGRLLWLDAQIGMQCENSFPRVCVQVELAKKLDGTMVQGINGEFYQDFEYKGLSQLCFNCGRINHKLGQCSESLTKFILKYDLRKQEINKDASSKATTLPVEVDNPHNMMKGLVPTSFNTHQDGVQIQQLKDDGKIANVNIDCEDHISEHAEGRQRKRNGIPEVHRTTRSRRVQ